MPAENMVIPADFGNTNVKFLINDELLFSDYSEDSLKKISLKIISNFQKGNFCFIYSTVNSLMLEKFKTYFDEEVLFINAKKLLETKKIINFENINGIGEDRLFGLAGALKYTDAPFITVDCGTAVTINILDKNNTVLGGCIFPGLHTQSKSLAILTANLTETDITDNKLLIGKDTASAIRSGIIASVTGGIKYIVEESEKSLFDGRNLPLLLTGGNADVIRDNLLKWRKDILFVNSLVLDGLIYTYRY